MNDIYLDDHNPSNMGGAGGGCGFADGNGYGHGLHSLLNFIGDGRESGRKPRQDEGVIA